MRRVVPRYDEPSATRHRASGAEPALPARVAAQGAEKVDLAEGRPVGVAEVQFRVGALPEQEVRQALLAARADDQVGFRVLRRVQVCGDVVDGQGFRDLGERAA